jgi:DNA polymerase-3 subunit alpha
MTVLMSANINNYDKLNEYVYECRRMGIQVLAPDINESDYDFKAIGDKIRIGLGVIKNASSKAITNIIQTREELGGSFKSFYEFCETIDQQLVDKRSMESFIKAGIFDCFGMKRSFLLNNFESIMKIAQVKKKEREKGQLFTFATSSYPVNNDLSELPQETIITYEKQAMGFYLTENPIVKHRRILDLISATTIDSLPDIHDVKHINIAGVISNVKLKITHSGQRKGTHYVTFTLSDLTGTCEVIIFAGDLERNRKHLKEDNLVMIKGDIDYRQDTPSLIARRVIPIKEAIRTFIKALVFSFDCKNMELRWLDPLYDLILAHKGSVPVFFDVDTVIGRKVTLSLPSEYKIQPSDKFIEELEKLIGADRFSFIVKSDG